MKLSQLITAIKKRIIGPKVYSVEMVCQGLTFLHMTVAYSLEDALQLARAEILRDNQKAAVGLHNWVMGKYAFAELEYLVMKASETDIVPVDGEQPTDKNMLMSKILKEKNVDLFNENLSIFTAPEKAMLREKLAITK